MTPLPRPPGPTRHFPLGSLSEFRQDPLGFFTRCAREYGDIVYFRIAGNNVYLINRPDYIESVLVTNSRGFLKGKVVHANRSLLGNGLLTNEGDSWLHERRLVQPAFHRDRIEAYADAIVGYGARMLSDWAARPCPARDIHADMKRLTQQIIAGTLFNVDVSGDIDEVGAMLAAVWKQFSRRIGAGLLIPEYLPTPGNIQLRRAIRRLDDVVYRIIAKHQAISHPSPDVLSALLAAAARSDDAGMTAQQLRDEVLTLFVAGHETTAQALSWAWYLLALHPAAQATLADELITVLKGRLPAATDVASLKYTEWVALEAMRLYPPVWGIPRIAIRDCEIGGYHIPAGSSVTMSQWVMHRDPRFFEHPAAFIPERWGQAQAQTLPRFAYFPFGGGPRQCIGAGFAMLEAILLIATIAQSYHFTLAPGQTVIPVPSITLYPRDGIKVLFTRRVNSSSN